jgi:energy-coupling factor transport system permease protein
MARSDALLARRNPVAKVLASLALTLALLSTLDPLTPAVAIAVELAVVPLFGLRYRDLGRRAGPLLVTAVGIIISLMIFAAEREGAIVFALGPLVVTTGVLASALGLCLRLFAVALPALIVLATTDPTDLADALVQNAKAPARFAIGALAALRLLPLLAAEWRTLTLARRARGLDAGRNPVAAVRIFASTAFALLVGAIRRGTRLATAMDARGFDSSVPRTAARVQRFGPADWALIAGGGAIGVCAVLVSVALGVFRPLLA